MAQTDKYSNYSYSRLLLFLEDGYLHDTERINYAQMLLEMQNANSLENLLTIYDSVFKKIPHFIYLAGYIPNYWHHYNCWAGYKSYLAEELNLCLNENILMLLQRTDNPSKAFCLSCLVNLRVEEHCEDISKKILLHCKEKLEPKFLQNIFAARQRIKQFCLDDCPYEIGTNGFKIKEKEYQNAKKKLLKYGYIESVVERECDKEAGIKGNDFAEIGGELTSDSNNKVAVIIALIVLLLLILLVIKVGLMGLIIIIVGIPAALKASKII